MKTLIETTKLAVCLSLVGTASLTVGTVAAWGQEGAGSPGGQQVFHNSPESVTGTLEGNEADLLSSWRLLSGLAVRLLSGNEAELLSGNEATLLSNNDPHLLSGNKIALFSNNTLQIHLTDSGNNNVGGDAAPGNDKPDVAKRGHPQGRPEQALRRQAEIMQARLKAAESRAKALNADKEARARALAEKLSKLQTRVQELADQNRALQAKIAELEAANQ